MVIKLPEVPDTVKVVTVWVVPAVNRIEWAAVPSSLKSAKVFEPAIVNDAVLAPGELQKLLYVFPPPEKVLVPVLVTLIVEVF
jgi:hypothetical protein